MSSSDSASAHTILSDTVFVKGHDSMELQIPPRSENEVRIARKPEEFFRQGQR